MEIQGHKNAHPSHSNSTSCLSSFDCAKINDDFQHASLGNTSQKTPIKKMHTTNRVQEDFTVIKILPSFPQKRMRIAIQCVALTQLAKRVCPAPVRLIVCASEAEQINLRGNKISRKRYKFPRYSKAFRQFAPSTAAERLSSLLN